MAEAVTKVSEAVTSVGQTGTDAADKVLDAAVHVDIKQIEPYVFNNYCCSQTTVGLNYPDCIGMSYEGIVFGCIAARSDALKPVLNNPDVVCLFSDTNIMCIKPGKVLCKTKQQFFCIENRCALPCDSDAPFGCTICFIEIFRSNEFTTNIKPKIVVLPRSTAVKFSAPTLPSIARN